MPLTKGTYVRDGVTYTEYDLPDGRAYILPLAEGQLWGRPINASTGAPGRIYKLTHAIGYFWYGISDDGNSLSVDRMWLDGNQFTFRGWATPGGSGSQTPKPADPVYPHSCPRCGSPSFNGVVPADVDCSNDKCPTKKVRKA
jgi:hypothetical protein